MHDSALHEGYGNGWDEDEPIFQDREKIEFGTLLLKDDYLLYWNGAYWEPIVENGHTTLSQEEISLTNDILSSTRDEMLTKSKEALVDFIIQETFNITLSEEMLISKLEEWESFGITPEQLDILLGMMEERIEDEKEFYQKLRHIRALFDKVENDRLANKGWKMVAVSPDAFKILDTLSECSWKLIQEDGINYLYLDS